MDKLHALEQLPQGNPNMVANILTFIYTAAGLTAVGYIIYAGYMYVRSEGDVGKVRQAYQMITFALIGLAVVILAAVVTSVVIVEMEGVKQ